MKNIGILILLWTLIFLAGSCTNANQSNYTTSSAPISIGDYDITIIDKCEYIVIKYDRSKSLTHKGNCKNQKL